MLSKLFLYSLAGFAQLSPLHAEFVSTSLPTLTLPWGKYEGQPMSDDENIYLFENVRFGASPPRFDAPAFPTWFNTSVQPTSDGRNCIQIDPKKLENPPGGKSPFDTPVDQDTEQDEDCLFLDLYVPKAALDGTQVKPMPVVVWLYGGGFAMGSKRQLGPLYTGRSVITASKYQTIFVAGNYRLGAFGWLAGDYMQKHGQPNAGLYDQALLFQWVQKYIGQVHGDKSQVTAWGESAGAGSILHHLVREDGAVDPTFKTFAVQSPGFEWAWDNSPMGTLDQVYQNFSCLAGCGLAFDLDCLRASKNLTDANQALYNTTKQTGMFPLGPAVDGKWITTIPTLSFARGNYWQSIQSTIVSHCLDESYSFTPRWVNSSDTFTRFLNIFLPGEEFEPQREKIAAQYDCTGPPWNGDWHACIGPVIRDIGFTCHTRDLYSAYPTVSHMIRYGFLNAELAFHGVDLMALFANNLQEVEKMLEEVGLDNQTQRDYYARSLVNTNVSRAYQTYFASFTLSGGNPNTLDMPLVHNERPPEWPVAVDGEELQNVLRVQVPYGQPGFLLESDDQNSQSACAFWTEIAREIMEMQEAAIPVKEEEVEEMRIPNEL